ncbi:hypothetical protein [Bosea sp. AS-1]|uniref:hypothetical protein n=1 Tax=Bosea sp. AS-1 TaxID=2015316 RepID=UPI000B76D6E0|nr:hypothetical protein [Bosea sp. AS-1]
MSLYQRVAYITPDGAIDVIPQMQGNGSLGTGLFVTKRTFLYNNYAGNAGFYTLDRQGLISLMANDYATPWGTPYADGGYRVVTEVDGTMDPLTFLQAMSSLCSYGAFDEGQSQAQLLTIAKSRPVEMRCGLTTAFVRGCAPSVGVETRQVHLMSVSRTNGFDDGHIALEAKVGGAWKFFDVPNDRGWADISGQLLSLADVVVARPSNCVPVKLAESRVGRATAGATCWLSAFYEAMFRSPAMVLDWCERVYEVPGMAMPNGGICWGVPPGLASYTTQIANYPGTNGTWTALPFSQWRSTFY